MKNKHESIWLIIRIFLMDSLKTLDLVKLRWIEIHTTLKSILSPLRLKFIVSSERKNGVLICNEMLLQIDTVDLLPIHAEQRWSNSVCSRLISKPIGQSLSLKWYFVSIIVLCYGEKKFYTPSFSHLMKIIIRSPGQWLVSSTPFKSLNFRKSKYGIF